MSKKNLNKTLKTTLIAESAKTHQSEGSLTTLDPSPPSHSKDPLQTDSKSSVSPPMYNFYCPGKGKEYRIKPKKYGKNSKCYTWVEENDFYCPPVVPTPAKGKGKRSTPGSMDRYLLLGFDTEFKTPPRPIEPGEITSGAASESGLTKSLIVSYQFHAKTNTGLTWQGVCIPEDGERLSLQEFLVFALGLGARRHGIQDIPKLIFLVGHFTRADLPAFSNFQDLTNDVAAVRNTFVSTEASIKQQLPTIEGKAVEIDVRLRDTLLLTPQGSKNLKAIGTLVGINKVELSPQRDTYQSMIRNMDRVRDDQWELFERYALTDAVIPVNYLERVMSIYKSVTGKTKVPITLTSIGVDLLLKTWKESKKFTHLDALGKEMHKKSEYIKKLGRYVKKTVEVDIPSVHWNVPFATECYHGGRGEQFWFGPCFADNWSDFDLASAYPTAMSLIGLPDWRGMKDSTCLEDYLPSVLGLAEVQFEFPESVRYPVLPVRTSHGLIFPRKGTSYCSSPEIFVAKQLGAQMKITKGLVMSMDPSKRIFHDFITECLNKRNEAGKKTIEGLFWKEISNSTYGKTAQGLREKRIYDLRDRSTRLLPRSDVTNAYFAAFITSFVRALLGEIMNAIPQGRMVFSCTTDGFLSNITDEEATRAASGHLGKLFAEQRKSLTGVSEVIEKKHFIRQPLGWRTRGQASLVPGDPIDANDESHIVLAKGGIYTPPELEDDASQNDEIVRMFFERKPGDMITVEAKTGVREMVEHDVDFVEKLIHRRLNMEYDWKRCPTAFTMSKTYNHIAFNTRPWETVDQFDRIREVWDDYAKNSPTCIKTSEDLKQFANYVETRSFEGGDHKKYLHKRDGDLERLRKLLCSAYKQSMAGLRDKQDGMTNQGFAKELTSCGIPCTKFHVENGKKQLFVPNSCPPTAKVLSALNKLKQRFPALDSGVLLYEAGDSNPIKISLSGKCPFIQRVR